MIWRIRKTNELRTTDNGRQAASRGQEFNYFLFSVLMLFMSIFAIRSSLVQAVSQTSTQTNPDAQSGSRHYVGTGTLPPPAPLSGEKNADEIRN